MKRTLLTLIALAIGTAGHSQFLTVIDSQNDKVLLFSALDGRLINDNFIPDLKAEGGTGGSYTPKDILDTGSSFLVSDQLKDRIYEFNYDGSFRRVAVSTGIDNVRGMTLHRGKLLISNAGNQNGAVEDSIQEFNLDGTGQRTWATGIDSFDVASRGTDVLVTDIGNDDVVRFDADGNRLGILVNSDGVNGIDFPQQLHVDASGGLWVAGFSPPIGIFKFDGATGSELRRFAVGNGNRGVWTLSNGNVLFTDGDSVSVIDVNTGAVRDVVSGGAYQYIGATGVPEPTTIAAIAIGLIGLARRRRR